MNKLLVFSMLMVCHMVFCFAVSIIPPFFPPFAQGKGISLVLVGIIFSANPIGAIIASLILGKIMAENNRFYFMLQALIMQGLGLFLFGLTNFQDKQIHIIATAFMADLINGYAISCFLTPLYAYIAELFPDCIEQKVSVIETIGGIGYILGPVCGSWIYEIGGYLAPFVLVGSLSLSLVPIMAYMFSRMRKTQVNDERKLFMTGDYSDSCDTIIDMDDIPLDYLDVIQSYPVFMMCMNGFMVNFMFNFLSPILADHYDRVYGASPSTIGYYLCVLSATYSVASLIIGYVKKGKLKLLMMGGFVIGIAAFFVGPDKRLTGLSHKYQYTLSAIAVLGVGSAPMVVYNFPLINSFLISNYPKQPIQCANMASALQNYNLYKQRFTITSSLGELLAPLLSGSLVELFSFDTACSVLGCICIFQAILFIPVFLKFKKIEG